MLQKPYLNLTDNLFKLRSYSQAIRFSIRVGEGTYSRNNSVLHCYPFIVSIHLFNRVDRNLNGIKNMIHKPNVAGITKEGETECFFQKFIQT